jgi:hypothetical protein
VFGYQSGDRTVRGTSECLIKKSRVFEVTVVGRCETRRRQLIDDGEDIPMAGDVAGILRSLKDQALAATRNRDQDFYRGYLADDAVAVLPAGIFDKAAVLAALAGPQVPFQASKIEDTRVTVLGLDSGIVTYRATLASGAVFVTTVYARRNGTWQGILYQQTALEA